VLRTQTGTPVALDNQNREAVPTSDTSSEAQEIYRVLHLTAALVEQYALPPVVEPSITHAEMWRQLQLTPGAIAELRLFLPDPEDDR
jgi:hypothetical protein